MKLRTLFSITAVILGAKPSFMNFNTSTFNLLKKSCFVVVPID